MAVTGPRWGATLGRLTWPGWWNGRHASLRSWWPQGREGSNPLPGTALSLTRSGRDCTSMHDFGARTRPPTPSPAGRAREWGNSHPSDLLTCEAEAVEVAAGGAEADLGVLVVVVVELAANVEAAAGVGAALVGD